MVLMLLALALGVLPLLGIAWILQSGSLFTVDGLFTTLMLLALSATLLLNPVLEMLERRKAAAKTGGK